MKWIAMGLALVIVIAVGAWWYDGHRAESALLAQPVYRVLKKHEPALFEEIVAEYKVYQRDEEKREQFVNFANAKIAETATHIVPPRSRVAIAAPTMPRLSASVPPEVKTT